MTIQRESFGSTPSGEPIERITLDNDHGMQAHIITFGATLTHLFTPDRDGHAADVVWGFDNLDAYLNHNHQLYLGATIGRVANRLGQAKFEQDGKTYPLAANHGQHHLHGGTVGFNRVVWHAHAQETQAGPDVTLSYLSRDGEEGYPGNLEVNLRYSLSHDNVLRLDYHATTDQATPVNLTHHSYFNLLGKGDISNHLVQIFADRVLHTDDELIPSGAFIDVDGTALDLRHQTCLAERLASSDHHIRRFDGFDHCYVLEADGLKRAAIVSEASTGRRMEVVTDQPALQFYTGNSLTGTAGKQGINYGKHTALCLETQHYPDAPNQSNFPSITLQANERYSHSTLYKFTTNSPATKTT
jgi:aldose 1-epimerase